MLVFDTPKVGNDIISSTRETVYPCSHSLKGVAITGLAQELIKHSIEATECLKSDATGVYNPNCHMTAVAVRR